MTKKAKKRKAGIKKSGLTIKQQQAAIYREFLKTSGQLKEKEKKPKKKQIEGRPRDAKGRFTKAGKPQEKQKESFPQGLRPIVVYDNSVVDQVAEVKQMRKKAVYMWFNGRRILISDLAGFWSFTLFVDAVVNHYYNWYRSKKKRQSLSPFVIWTIRFPSFAPDKAYIELEETEFVGWKGKFPFEPFIEDYF